MVVSNKFLRYFRLSISIIFVFSVLHFIDLPAQAANFQQAYVRIDRMAVGTATSGLVCAQAATAATEAKVIVTFPPGFGVNTTAANWTTTVTNLPAGSTAWIGIGTATSVSAQAVTFPSGDLVVGTLYCFNFTGTSTLTTPAGAANSLKGNVQTQTAASAGIDQTQYALAVVNNDQIIVTAVVPPIFIFSLDSNADSFATDLDPTAINTTAGRTFTVTTNAKGGWIAWAKDTQQGLFSATSNYKINTIGTVDGVPSTVTAGTEAYQLVSRLILDFAAGCTVTTAAEYTSTATQGGTFSANYQPVATCTGASPATSGGDQVMLLERATIAGNTPAASDYTDTVTVVGAADY